MKILFLVIFICLGIDGLNAQTGTMWDYPVKPGTPQWASITDHKDMIKVSQIPENVLKSISTKELIQLCLDYPLHADFYAYNSLQEGVKKVSTYFNGLQELFNRPDNAQYLLEYLKSFEQEIQPNIAHTPINSGECTINQMLVEVFLSQETVLSNASPTIKKEILSTALKNMLQKEILVDIYGNMGVGTSAYLLCLGLNSETDLISQSTVLNQFSRDAYLKDSSIIEELVLKYSLYLKNNSL